MKKILIPITAVLLLLSVSSCEKSPERMDIKLSFTIDGGFEPESVEDYARVFTVISDIEVDKDQNIYLYNPRLGRIMKYDRDGNYLKHFGASGTSMGQLLNTMDFVILNDTINFKNTYKSRIVRYTLDGEFVDELPYNEGHLHLGEINRAVSDDKLVGYISAAVKTDSGIFHTNKLAIMDKRFNELAVLREYSAKMDRERLQFFEFMTKFTHGNGNIYVADNDEDEYRINVFDHDGNKIDEIKRKYRKTAYNNKEMEVINNMPLSVRKSRDSLESVEAVSLYKKSVNALFYDKYGRLIVCPSVERTAENMDDFIIDIFENGKFSRRAFIPQLKGEDYLYRTHSDIYFLGGRIFEVVHSERKVNVYEY